MKPKEAFVIAKCFLPPRFDGVVGVYATAEFKPALLKTERLPGVSIRLYMAAHPLVGRLVSCDGSSYELGPLFSTPVEEFMGFRVTNEGDGAAFVLTLRGRAVKIGGDITSHTVRGVFP